MRSGLTDLAAVILALVGIIIVFFGGSIVLDWLDLIEQRIGWLWFRVIFWVGLALLLFFVTRWRRRA